MGLKKISLEKLRDRDELEAALQHKKKMRPLINGRVCEYCGGPVYDDWEDGPPIEKRTGFLGLHCPNKACSGKKKLPLLPLPNDGEAPF